MTFVDVVGANVTRAREDASGTRALDSSSTRSTSGYAKLSALSIPQCDGCYRVERKFSERNELRTTFKVNNCLQETLLT